MKITKINPDEVSIQNGNFDKDEKRFLINTILNCYELAEKNSKKGSLTTASYACALIDDNMEVYYGVNFNNTRNEISSICAERSAILNIYNSKVKNYNDSKKFNYKVKYMILTSYRGKNIFWEDRVTPCADCLSWFNTDVHFTIDTKILTLKKENDKIYLLISPLANFLPLRNLTFQIPDDIFEIKKSESVKNTKIKDEKIIELFNKTYKVYKNNLLAQTSGQNIASGAIINGEIFTGCKIDFSKRWFIEPLLAACYKGFEKYGQNSQVEAICYVGDEYTKTENGQIAHDGLISLKTLGRLNTKFLNADTIIITGAKNCLEVRTINDFMPQGHVFVQNYDIV